MIMLYINYSLYGHYPSSPAWMCFHTQVSMIQQDRLVAEKADAKNALEEYVYEMRDKLETTLQEYISEKVSTNSFVIYWATVIMYHVVPAQMRWGGSTTCSCVLADQLDSTTQICASIKVTGYPTWP